MITNDTIDSSIYCRFKAHLKLNGAKGNVTEYESYYNAKTKTYLSSYFQKIHISKKSHIAFNQLSDNSQLRHYDYIFNYEFVIEDIHLKIDALEKKIVQETNFYIPIFVIPYEKISTHEKLLVSYFSNILKKSSFLIADYCKIIYGENLNVAKVQTSNYIKRVKDTFNYLKSNNEPNLVLNKHCRICEFYETCKLKAIKDDSLSLFGGMSEKELKKWNNKGIFTINQLSYNFRPRKQRSGNDNKFNPHKFELRALAIRENNIYIIDEPKLVHNKIELYLDIESLPDEDFVYLIGLVAIDNGKETFYSFWANSKNQEIDIFSNLLSKINEYDEYTVFHYSNYEISKLKYIRKKLTKIKQLLVDKLIDNSINLLTYFHSTVYLPIYSNSLKEIGQYLGFSWSDPNASGINSIIWRKQWELNNKSGLQEKIQKYNYEDCIATLKVKYFIESIIRKETSEKFNVVKSSNIKNPIFHGKHFASVEFESINKCSYFSYQREKVFVRTDDILKKNAPHNKLKVKKHRVNECIYLNALVCPQCKSQSIRKHRIIRKRVVDLRFSSSGVKRWIKEFISYKYVCRDCSKDFSPEKYNNIHLKYGHNLMSWVIFQNIEYNESFYQISKNLIELFDLDIKHNRLQEFKEYISNYYRLTYSKINKKILGGPIIYADETQFKLKDESGYVWVFTNNNEAICFYQPTREGDFLKQYLKFYRGVLVSDFYASYDSINCVQQKCLIHLIRDLDSDLLNNPFDNEYKAIINEFTILIQAIIKTVDKYGLKRYHLKKHIIEANRFIQNVTDNIYTSEIAIKYQKRILKNKDKLFTFLEYDNVSWNNTNAEHAIKLMATHRNKYIKIFRTTRIDDYLTIMTIYMTCKYKEISFLKFLLSKDKDIYKFCLR